jgi:hypothetical protein
MLLELRFKMRYNHKIINVKIRIILETKGLLKENVKSKT